MSPALGLVLVVVAIYVAECVLWVRRGATVFVSRTRRRFRPVVPARWTDVARGGFVLTATLPPLGSACVCQAWPLAVSEEGVSVPRHAAASESEGGPVYLRWDEIGDVSASGHRVWAAGELIAEMASDPAAADLAQGLRRLAESAPADRGGVLDELVAASFDDAQARSRVDAWRRAGATLVVTANLLFAIVAATLLGILGLQPLVTIWPLLALTCVPVLGLLGFDFHRAHRALHPDARSRRRALLLMMALSPPMAVRAPVLVARDLLATSHPLAAAAVLCDRRVFEEHAERTLRRLRHPLPGKAASRRAERAEESFRARVLARAEDLIRRCGLDPAALLAVPAAGRADERTHCPRCLARYALESGECSDCPGIGLVALGPWEESGRAEGFTPDEGVHP